MIIDTVVAGTAKSRFREGARDSVCFPSIITSGDKGREKKKSNGGRPYTKPA